MISIYAMEDMKMQVDHVRVAKHRVHAGPWGARSWLGLAVAAGLGVGTATAQDLFDFETDLEGWAAVSFPEAGQVISVTQSTVVASLGTGSMAVTKTPDQFSWTVQVASGEGTTFYDVISNAVSDADTTYDLVFDIIFRAADLPGAGGTDTTYVNSLVAMSSDPVTNDVGGGEQEIRGGWHQTADAFGLGAAEIEALIDTAVVPVRVPLSSFNLSQGSSLYEMTLSLNGNYGSNATATVYYDNVRLEPFSPIFFDFTDGLDGWTDDELCGEVFLATDVPIPGEQSMEFHYSDFGPCRPGVVTKVPSDGHPMFHLIRDAVRDHPAGYNLEFDLILLASDLPGGATFLNPIVVFNADDGMSWDQQVLTEFQIDLTAIAADTILPLQIPLDTWLWPADSSWAPSFIQMGLGTEVDNGGTYSFYFDNFAIRPVVVEPPPAILVTGLDIQSDGTLSLRWGSVTDAVYAVSMATDPEAADWTLVASNLLAQPPENTWTNDAAAGAMELFRVEQATGGLVIPLFGFEGGTDGWVASAPEITATNSDVAATSGTHSLAATFGQNPYWRVNWTSGEYETNNTAYAAIRDALLDATRTWYIAADFIYDGPGLNATNSIPPAWVNQQVAFNGPEAGWRDSFTGIAPLNGAQIQALGTNQTAFTWGVRLSETGWGTATNSWYQMNIGVSTDWSNMSEATLYYDNVRLTTQEP